MGSEQIILLVGGVVLGLVGAPTLFQWIKHVFGLTDTWALIVVYGSSVVLAIVALLVSGELKVVELTFENVVALAQTIIVAAIFSYKVLMGKAKNPES